MSSISVAHVEHPTQEQLDASVALFAFLMKNAPALISLSGGDISLLDPMGRAMILAGIPAGEYYAATDDNGQLVGFMFWTSPGQELFSTPEQRELGLNDFMAKLSAEGKEYYKKTYSAEFPQFVESCLGPTGKLNSWWLHMAMVHPDYQRQGIATRLIGLVREKATQKGETLALSTTSAKNVHIYKAIGFELKGERIMPSPWGDWPLYVFSLNTQRS
ncbi:hypothetical protein AcV7_003819 [Taiwanofungus camphoratus]|nr:hypothetical protein AcV7_003819 [Antrodia cinnamomea]